MKINWKKAHGVPSIVGFGFLSAAAWTLAMGFGLAAIGVSLLVLDWLLEEGAK
jgi:hypothetical protein